MSIKIKDFIFCDDIRAEVGNKYSAMGIYGDKVRISLIKDDVKQINLPLSALIRIQKESTHSVKDYNFKINVSFKAKNIASVEGDITFGDGSVLVLPINKLNFQFSDSGELKFELEIINSNTQVLKHSEMISIHIIRSEDK